MTVDLIERWSRPRGETSGNLPRAPRGKRLAELPRACYTAGPSERQSQGPSRRSRAEPILVITTTITITIITMITMIMIMVLITITRTVHGSIHAWIYVFIPSFGDLFIHVLLSRCLWEFWEVARPVKNNLPESPGILVFSHGNLQSPVNLRKTSPPTKSEHVRLQRFPESCFPERVSTTGICRGSQSF